MEPGEFRGTIAGRLRRVGPVVARATASGVGLAQRGPRRARRRRLRPAGVLRLRHRHPDPGPPGRRRAAVHQLPHHRALLPHPLLPAHRPQPPQQRHGAGGRAGHRVPGVRRHHRPGQRLPGQVLVEQRLRHVGRGQVAPGPRGRVPPGRPPAQLAARTGIRALLRVHGGRDPPVRARARVRQPPGRPRRRRLRGRLPPHRGPGRPRHRHVDRRPPGHRRRQALLPLLLPGRLPLAAPGAAPVDRPVPGRFDRGWDVWREATFDRQLADGDPARRVPSSRPVRTGYPPWDTARPTRAAPVRPLHGGVRRLPVPHRRPARPARRLPRADR